MNPADFPAADSLPAGPEAERQSFLLDGRPVPFLSGDTVLSAAARAGRYIPHLCWKDGFHPHGSCRLCTVKINGRGTAACTQRATAGLDVQSDTPALNAQRRMLLQMLFVEGNHFCPGCEKSGDCLLQASAYEMGMESPRFEEFYPERPVDASHPDLWIDFNRCILCELCVRASRDLDGKDVFAISGHGTGAHLVVNSDSGRLGDSDIATGDRAASVCPVGAILPKRRGFQTPIGRRRFDAAPVSAQPEPTEGDAS